MYWTTAILSFDWMRLCSLRICSFLLSSKQTDTYRIPVICVYEFNMYYNSRCFKLFGILLFAPKMVRLKEKGIDQYLSKSSLLIPKKIHVSSRKNNYPRVFLSTIFNCNIWIKTCRIVSLQLNVYLCVCASVPVCVCVRPFMYILKHPWCSLDLVSRQLLGTVHIKSQ